MESSLRLVNRNKAQLKLRITEREIKVTQILRDRNACRRPHSFGRNIRLNAKQRLLETHLCLKVKLTAS
jgi:hypothetical protein